MAIHILTAKVNDPRTGIVKGQQFRVTLPDHVGINTPKGVQTAQRQIMIDTGISVSNANIYNGFHKTKSK